MEPLEISYPTLDVVPEPFRPLYEARDGAVFLTKVNGLKTNKDIEALSGALAKERNDHKGVRDALKVWEGLDAADVRAKIARYPELEAAASGKLDDSKINSLVEQRIAQKTGPLENSLKGVAAERDSYKAQWETAIGQLHRRDLNDLVRAAATEMKVHASAIPDIEMNAGAMLERIEGDNSSAWVVKAGINGVTPGLDVKGWLKEMQKTRTHWWPMSVGGGAGGGGGLEPGEVNPFSHDGWNFSKQSELVREKGQSVAEQLAKAAGTTVGGPRPAKK